MVLLAAHQQWQLNYVVNVNNVRQSLAPAAALIQITSNFNNSNSNVSPELDGIYIPGVVSIAK